ncbi:hypothetical protein TNCV_3992401 [Trichonephila clavipes]|uniref:Uncharacterized protein n=1 Tax=Trichonephila clavipes TaxID=2585209 RepID=A0A8X6SZU0_TRICX|nr:hypothetical protein TNCV_3992401 [Trichonephila clavipes]
MSAAQGNKSNTLRVLCRGWSRKDGQHGFFRFLTDVSKTSDLRYTHQSKDLRNVMLAFQITEDANTKCKFCVRNTDLSTTVLHHRTEICLKRRRGANFIVGRSILASHLYATVSRKTTFMVNEQTSHAAPEIVAQFILKTNLLPDSRFLMPQYCSSAST